MAAWSTATEITGWVVTSGTRWPRKKTVRPSRKLSMYCWALRRGMLSSFRLWTVYTGSVPRV